jgi:hypothetical protein
MTDIEVLQQAETSLQKASGGFSFFGGRQEKCTVYFVLLRLRWSRKLMHVIDEAAAEQFIAAANAFRMQKMGTTPSKEIGSQCYWTTDIL